MADTCNILSSQEGLISYFTKIKELQKSGETFPVDLDKVWPLAYARKNECLKFLHNKFIENIDYQIFSQKAENSLTQDKRGRKPICYHITVSCMEFLIARRHRPVFDIYRRVFHSAMESIGDSQEAKPAVSTQQDCLDTSHIRKNNMKLCEQSDADDIASYLMYCKQWGEKTGTIYIINVDDVWKLAFKSKRRVTDRLLGINGMPSVYKQWHDYIADPAIRPDRVRACGHRFLMNAQTFFSIIAVRNENARKAWNYVFATQYPMILNEEEDISSFLSNTEQIEQPHKRKYENRDVNGIYEKKAELADLMGDLLTLQDKMKTAFDKNVLQQAIKVIGKYNKMLNNI